MREFAMQLKSNLICGTYIPKKCIRMHWKEKKKISSHIYCMETVRWLFRLFRLYFYICIMLQCINIGISSTNWYYDMHECWKMLKSIPHESNKIRLYPCICFIYYYYYFLSFCIGEQRKRILYINEISMIHILLSYLFSFFFFFIFVFALLSIWKSSRFADCGWIEYLEKKSHSPCALTRIQSAHFLAFDFSMSWTIKSNFIKMIFALIRFDCIW